MAWFLTLHGVVSYFAWRGFLRLSVYVSVCVSVNKISQKMLNLSTPFLVEAFPVTQGGKPFNFEKKSLWCKGGGVCVWRAKFGPNDKTKGNFFRVAITLNGAS